REDDLLLPRLGRRSLPAAGAGGGGAGARGRLARLRPPAGPPPVAGGLRRRRDPGPRGDRGRGRPGGRGLSIAGLLALGGDGVVLRGLDRSRLSLRLVGVPGGPRPRRPAERPD